MNSGSSPTISLSPNSLSFSTAVGGANPAAQDVTVSNDIWFNGGWNNEVMIQTDLVNRGGQCGPVLATVQFGGTNGVPVHTWDLCVYGTETIWQFQGTGSTYGMQSGSVDLLAMLKWLENNTNPNTHATYLPAGSTMYDQLRLRTLLHEQCAGELHNHQFLDYPELT